jgi:hypothetical protein
VSLTAAQKNRAVNGTLAARIKPVVVLPKSGSPELISKTQPTPAIAAIQDNNNKTPLFGVIFTPHLN